MASGKGFAVLRGADLLSGLICDHPRSWIALGNLETRYLEDRLTDIAIVQPVYVAGLARAGTTIVLEALARHPSVATHRYRDFPAVFTPYWWDRLLSHTPRRAAEPVERAHADRIMVTADSPEAMEEMLWTAFFGHLHDPRASNVLDASSRDPAFERFYRDHVAKLLLVRGRSRYVAKGNYNVTRLDALLRLFPDARFVVPVREPAAHVASLVKQHALFTDALRDNPRARRHLARVGHFEFGPDRRPINAGDADAVERVLSLWAEGREVAGWAAYWSHVYGFVADRLAERERLAAATLVVRYESLCREPRETLRAVFAHCRLADAEPLIDSFADSIRFPTYYRPSFTDQERAEIASETAAVAARFGYGEAEGA
jgi:hypothetical protein